jgi:hypothetical protein
MSVRRGALVGIAVLFGTLVLYCGYAMVGLKHDEPPRFFKTFDEADKAAGYRIPRSDLPGWWVKDIRVTGVNYTSSGRRVRAPEGVKSYVDVWFESEQETVLITINLMHPPRGTTAQDLLGPDVKEVESDVQVGASPGWMQTVDHARGRNIRTYWTKGGVPFHAQVSYTLADLANPEDDVQASLLAFLASIE